MSWVVSLLTGMVRAQVEGQPLREIEGQIVSRLQGPQASVPSVFFREMDVYCVSSGS